MAVPVTEFKGLDELGTGDDGLIERVRSASRESGAAILLPHTVQRFEPRC